MPTKLWQVEHPYRCEIGNFFAAPGQGVHEVFDSWSDFMADFGRDMDDDYNFLYRWDWQKPDPDDEEDDGVHRLFLFFVAQRKARNFSIEVAVDPDDDVEIREWLQERWKYMQAVWAPINDDQTVYLMSTIQNVANFSKWWSDVKALGSYARERLEALERPGAKGE